ncbi:putative WEB family protein At4g17210 isoform X2 [Olea europaea var. sylvestris]|uniref:putative WEB family protein At4g17210 isoform X2 n=1 Tax=Olea europaea var. sylvestris TaxID=158386 RepID=UPI000C1D06B8|nr:putative WEB family protein At4g17210 isoform X2 [Olea europaea var. sylvestris]
MINTSSLQATSSSQQQKFLGFLLPIFSMGEIDTKPIESVQVAISLFDERKDSPTKNDEIEKEREVESLLKDLASVKVQLEVKDLAYKQAILKLDRYQKTQDELSTLLKNADSVKIKYIDECKKSNLCMNQLESTMKEMSDKLLEFENVQKQLSHVKNECMTSQEQVLNMETQLDGLRRAKVESTTQVEAMETALREEKLKTEELLMNVSQLNDTIFHMQMKAHEVDEENTETQLAEKVVLEAEAQLECTKKLEKELLEKSILTDLLQLELKQANEQCSCSQKVASDAINELNELKEEMEQRRRKNLDPAAYITSLETELEKSKTELTNANEEVGWLNADVERMRAELEKNRTKVIETGERDTEVTQVEIALLKSELQKGRSKLAAVEAAEARAQSEKSALYHAVHELALEAEEAKNENRKLKEIIKLANESKSEELVEKGELKANYEESEGGMEIRVTISRNEYENLIEKAERTVQVVELMYENEQELKHLKKELEAVTLKIGEHRTRAEQAISRAEAAEKAKVQLEEQKRRWKEHKERRKAAIAELREESYSKDYIASYKHDNDITNYQPLGKVLNMKF